MKPIRDILEKRIAEVLATFVDDGSTPAAIVKSSLGSKFGDYQANGVMGLAKKLKTNPRDLAAQVVEKLDLSEMVEQIDVAGPGFINITLDAKWLEARITDALQDPIRLGVAPFENPQRVVIDFSGPNIAKQMHVGHLRSTIIGDVIARVLEFSYNDPSKIIRQNHIGDWGLQMGMVCYALSKLVLEDYAEKHGQAALDDMRLNHPARLDMLVLDAGFSLEKLELYYKKVSSMCTPGSVTSDLVGDMTCILQGGAPHVILLWQIARTVTLRACAHAYEKLDVKLTMQDICGESFYGPQLPKVVSDLEKLSLIEESDGAKCVFLDGYKTKDDEPMGFIVQKSNGAYLYATTDLAALRYRLNDLHVDRVVIVTDARQKQHFEMMFKCARKAQWVSDGIQLEHVPFGSVLGEDNKPFKTRSGENIKLVELLDEAISRAMDIINEKDSDLSLEEKEKVARAVGIGSVKYADLSSNLTNDYVFCWDKMLAMEGNTAPYLQYVYARIQSIFRKGEINIDLVAENSRQEMSLVEDSELLLAKMLLRYGEVVHSVAIDLRPHLLTNYLFPLAQAFSTFFANCPVLKSEGVVRQSRLALCLLTGRTMKHGLGLLGIETVDRM